MDRKTGLWAAAVLGLIVGMFGAVTVNVLSAPPSPGLTVRGVVVEWKTRARVRLLDCWAAEVKTKDAAEKRAGLAAKEHLLEIVGKLPAEATLEFPFPSEDIGKATTLGRVLGRVWVEGQKEDVSKQMVRDGFATATKATD